MDVGAIGPCEEYEAEIARVCAAQDRPRRYEDADGYEFDIIAAAVEEGEAGQRLAWVECVSRERGTYLDITYTLYGQRDGRQVFKWEVETYNPYFGCDVQYLRWWEERLVILYREKHDTYVCSLAEDERRVRVEINDEWLLCGEVLYSRSETVDEVDRLTLPLLEAAPAWTAAQARAAGLLPPRYDELNEIHRQYGRR